jgi:hypothetical protein
MSAFPSLLCDHYSDIVVATGMMPVATMAYDPFLQWGTVVLLT